MIVHALEGMGKEVLTVTIRKWNDIVELHFSSNQVQQRATMGNITQNSSI